MEKKLNKEQLLAITHKSGPLLIIAGAGTGKTTVITERVKYLIEKKLALPEEILALTFTEKAAHEMEERVDIALPYGTFGLWISTFHSFCDRILRSEGLHLGLNPNFKLMTETESYLFVKKNFWKFDLDYFRPHGNPYKFIAGMLSHFSRLKDEDISPDVYQNSEYPELVSAYKTYEDLKVTEGVMDFADLITNTLKLFRNRSNVLARYQKQFKYILVDEFQDTNFAQGELVKLLSGKGGNVTIVADDDQSIYRFRGAAISNVIQFRKSFPNVKTITLTQNYRSTQEILDRSYELIQKNNPDRLEVKEKIDKKLRSQSKISGEKIEFLYLDRVENEAEAVVKKISELRALNYELRDFAILVRANNHSESFVRALERARIPYQFLGPGALFKQPEIKDLIAYLKVLADFTDSVSLYRVLSMEIFGISQRDIIEVLNKAKKRNNSFFEELESLSRHSGEDSERSVEDDSRIDSGQARMTKFITMVHRHQELIPKETAGQIIFYFLEDSGILKSVVDYKTVPDEKRAQNIAKFFDKLKNFEMANADASVFSIVDYLNLAMDMGESPQAVQIDWSQNNAVNILTIHSAKGLEFPVVFLVNLVEGRFPTYERQEQIPIPDDQIKEILPVGDFHLEEERRLFYVGMTRAKEKLFFSAAKFYGEGKRERKLSPFVREAIGEAVSSKQLAVSKENQLPLIEWSKPKEGLTPNPHPLTAMKIDYLSYSAIETFKICPLHYKLRTMIKIPTPMTSAQALGNSLHLTLRDLYGHSGLEPESILINNWILEGYGSKKHRDDTLVKAKIFLTNYLKTDLHKGAKPIYLEQPFTFRINDTLKIGGKLDRVDELKNGEIEIIDYKTGAKVPSQKEIDLNLQMTIYALAATNLFQKSVEKVKLSFYFFDNNTKISTTRTAQQLEEAKKDLLKIRDEIQSSDFSCSGNKLCENCEFKMLCNG